MLQWECDSPCQEFAKHSGLLPRRSMQHLCLSIMNYNYRNGLPRRYLNPRRSRFWTYGWVYLYTLLQREKMAQWQCQIWTSSQFVVPARSMLQMGGQWHSRRLRLLALPAFNGNDSAYGKNPLKVTSLRRQCLEPNIMAKGGSNSSSIILNGRHSAFIIIHHPLPL